MLMFILARATQNQPIEGINLSIKASDLVGKGVAYNSLQFGIYTQPTKDGIGAKVFLDETLYKEKLWTHRPLNDFWRIGKQTRAKLERYGIFCMKDMANAPFSLFERVFGIDAYIALDHANGIEPTTKQISKPISPLPSLILAPKYCLETTRN